MEEVDIRISLIALPPLTELAPIWQSLQGRADHSFFTSWAWIGCWLETLPKTVSPLLLMGERAGKIVGIGILVAKNRSQIKVFETPALYLNSTGNPYLDEVTIEYNGFLADRSGAQVIIEKMLNFLFYNQLYRCNEVLIHGAINRQKNQSGIPADTRLLETRKDVCYSVDLDLLRTSEQDYLATLSATRRYHIRRSIKQYAKLGSLNLIAAQSESEAIFFLGELRKFHQAYWNKKGSAGAFANLFFYEFIHRMVKTQFADGVVQMLRISVGDRPIGYLLNFVYQGHVYQYQSGFDYDVCKKYNGPGYVSHLYGVEYNLKVGHRIYDYMAGESNYKKSMGKPMSELSWQVVRRSSVAFRVEDCIRSTVRLLRKILRKT
jgi:CelD/BcsL family acetyltransferase involved in cellulose biosynthesis